MHWCDWHVQSANNITGWRDKKKKMQNNQIRRMFRHLCGWRERFNFEIERPTQIELALRSDGERKLTRILCVIAGWFHQDQIIVGGLMTISGQSKKRAASPASCSTFQPLPLFINIPRLFLFLSISLSLSLFSFFSCVALLQTMAKTGWHDSLHYTAKHGDEQSTLVLPLASLPLSFPV